MYLNEATLLNNVKQRYLKNKIYVSTCIILMIMIVQFPSTIHFDPAILKPDNGGHCRVRTGFVS